MPWALARQVVSCTVSPADVGSQEKFTLPGLSPARGWMACRGRALLQGGFGGTPGLAELPPPAVHSGVSAAGSRRWGGSGMFQPKGWEGGQSMSWPATATPSRPFGASLPWRLWASPHPGQESCAGPAGMAPGAGKAAASLRVGPQPPP